MLLHGLLPALRAFRLSSIFRIGVRAQCECDEAVDGLGDVDHARCVLLAQLENNGAGRGLYDLGGEGTQRAEGQGDSCS